MTPLPADASIVAVDPGPISSERLNGFGGGEPPLGVAEAGAAAPAGVAAPLFCC